MQKKQSQVITEQRNISNYAGLLFGRIALSACFFLLFVVLRPTSFYFLVFLLFCPLLTSNLLVKKQNNSEVLLTSCAKKYFYTPAKLASEKFIGTCIIFLLAFWQFLLAPKVTSLLSIRMAPGFLLLFYIICRITAKIVVRNRIHRTYMELTLLD